MNVRETELAFYLYVQKLSLLNGLHSPGKNLNLLQNNPALRLIAMAFHFY